MRSDLLALTPEAVAALANLGLVKRAQREIAAGEGPALEEAPDGVVVGRCPDGAVARLAPGVSLRDATCSCGATTLCRHRVAVALAYPAWHSSQGPAPVPEEAAPPPPPALVSPGLIDDAGLQTALGARVLDRARATLRVGVLIEIRRAAIAEAHLPTCTVRFLVPGDLAYARCDCVVGQSCEHVALAVWAFRRADEAGQAGGPVALGRSESAGEAGAEALQVAVELVHGVLNEGVSNLPVEAAPRFARVRAALESAGFVWPLDAVEALEQAAEAYRARSARYHAAEAAGLLVEIEARRRAWTSPGVLPARFVVGADEAAETLLDHVRLTSIGARVEADGRAREAEVYLADPTGGAVLVLRKRFAFTEAEAPEDAPTLARRQLAPRVGLGALAHGQIVSKVVKRRANREMTLGAARGGLTSLSGQTGDWSGLPATLLVHDLAAWRAQASEEPPTVLRPRLLAAALRVVAIAEVGEVHYRPGEQQLCVEVADAAGHPLTLSLRHRGVAPHALDALAVAAGRGLCYASGELRMGREGLEMEPVALVTRAPLDATPRPVAPTSYFLTVPDLVAERPPHAEPPPGRAPPGDALDAALAAAASVLEELAHLGLVHRRADVPARLNALADRVEGLGLTGLAVRLRALSRDPGPPTWLEAALWHRLATESMPLSG